MFHLIAVALSTGGIMEMPWHLLDPRRPVLGVNQQREEGTIPYIPELPLTSESIINYNQSLARIDGIYTAPSGLESTCLVVAYGLGKQTTSDRNIISPTFYNKCICSLNFRFLCDTGGAIENV